jgi:hypothetical protein
VTLDLVPGGAKLLVDHPPNHGDPDFWIPANDLLSVEVRERSGEPADTGSLIIDNRGGKYTLQDRRLQPRRDDRLVLRVATDQTASDEPFGADAFGDGVFGGWLTAGEWLIDSVPERDLDGYDSELDFDITDYVWGRLQRQRATYKDTDTPIAGSSEAHLDTILEREFGTDVAREYVEPISERIDYASHELPISRIVRDLTDQAARERGGAVAFGRRNQLHFRELDGLRRPLSGSVPESWSRGQQPVTIEEDFAGTAGAGGDGDEPINRVRVDGGLDTENVGDRNEPGQDERSFVQITDSNPVIAQVATRKSIVPTIEIYTRGDGTSGDGLRVRLQAPNSDGTGPVAPEDTDSDLIPASGPRKVALDDDGWTDFPFATENAFINVREPFLIIDARGADGYRIAVDESGRPAYRMHFAKQVVAVVADGRASDHQLPREAHIADDSIPTQAAARDRGEAYLARKARQCETVTPGRAKSYRAHRLRVGDVVSFAGTGFSILDMTGEHMVAERTVRYGGDGRQHRLDTDIEFVGLDALDRTRFGPGNGVGGSGGLS